MTIYFVAGEASADNHGAALLASLRKIDADSHFLGRGGPRMQAIAGGSFKNWIDEAAVVGLWEVIKRYGYFRKQFGEAFGTHRPALIALGVTLFVLTLLVNVLARWVVSRSRHEVATGAVR